MSAGMPKANTSATLCNSPPDNTCTSWSMMLSIFNGLTTSLWNCGFKNAPLIFLKNNWRTVPGKRGAIFCGFIEMFNLGTSVPLSAAKAPAKILQNVVLPVPFSPNITKISELVKSPFSTVNLKSPCVFRNVGYCKADEWSKIKPSAASAKRNCNDSSRNRMFSVGMKPSKKMLMPSRTDDGNVTTPYTEGAPYKMHTKSDK
ncbi:hypothetical protein METBIDRAFT_38783 [Metschnikowia bicuspidata var. bicuspidata NRRL YB-4993]|uniref:Uncharacterized protein n=1 Tax=Metschnikowia bicuspidata var. bicuspidata NRRL YB-4993 TaxID=869754 RepID=A0A1A0HER1_9ASCO|nr:hypothetical protein METBIDRAFT_38783 [Metschnikowia bicuspidata var. bicuspidata NRRL YB-4993]OBA22398.1 hypothetical protein METBIDRAFT_38783 [Metschnikowia bicuspidata var. bicuspidata NRRL YB-4993]